MIDYALYLAAIALQLILLALATDLLGGHCGRLGLSAVFFAGIGGYAYAILTTGFGFAPPLAILAALGCSALVSMALGPLMVRMGEDVFLLASLGLVLAFVDLTTNLELTGGPLGIPSVPAPVRATGPISGSLLILVPLSLLTVAGLLLTIGSRNPIRRACHAVRDDELAVTITGLSPLRVLLPAFIAHASVAALTGVGMVVSQAYVSPADFNIWLALNVITIVIVGGSGAAPYGAVVAAVLVIGGTEFLATHMTHPQLVGPSQRLVFNLLLLVFLMFWPRGIAGPVIERPPGTRIA